MDNLTDIGYYTFQDILDYMSTGQPFSLRYVAFDQRRKRGGEEKYISEAVLDRIDGFIFAIAVAWTIAVMLAPAGLRSDPLTTGFAETFFGLPR